MRTAHMPPMMATGTQNASEAVLQPIEAASGPNAAAPIMPETAPWRNAN